MPLAVGLMSGTSIDGIDAALVRISEERSHLRIKLLSWGIFPFPRGFREKVLAVSYPADGKTSNTCRLNLELGGLFAQAVFRICRKGRVPVSKLSVIGSHGQTICHLGREGTLQIGEPSVIAERTGVTTVADFRPRDIAAGGFGAPLASYLHYLLFRDSKRNRAVHNIGGISNLTFIPKDASLDRVIGFDTGPGNMVIDGLLQELFNKSRYAERASGFASGSGLLGGFGGEVGVAAPRHKVRAAVPHYYDHGGKMAARGLVSLKLLKALLAHPFILKKPPKTSGREEFGRNFVRRILRRGAALRLKDEDLIATATALTAMSIAENYRRFIFPRGIPDEIIFGGGGIHNATLMRMIRAELAGIPMTTFDQYGIPADAAEAVCFAVLAYETLRGRSTNLPSVTGAKRSVILGKIVPGVHHVPYRF